MYLAPAICILAATALATPLPGTSLSPRQSTTPARSCDIVRNSNLHCGSHGSLDNATVFDIFPARDINACRDVCLHGQRCGSIGYNRRTATCSLYTESIKAQSFTKQRGAPMIFYGRPCFQCHPSLINGGFDSGKLAPWTAADFNGATHSIHGVGGAVQPPPYVFQANIPGDTGGATPLVALQQFPVGGTRNVPSVLSFRYRTTTVTHLALTIVENDAARSALVVPTDGGTLGADTDWSMWTGAFTPAEDRFALRINIAANDLQNVSVLIDSARLSPAS